MISHARKQLQCCLSMTGYPSITSNNTQQLASYCLYVQHSKQPLVLTSSQRLFAQE